MAVELDVEALTPNQAARRQRVIDAAMKLAADGGYDAVQMRDVASEAGVALWTIYRYFASKDHLLAACQVEFARGEQRRLELRPTQGETAATMICGTTMHPAISMVAQAALRVVSTLPINGSIEAFAR